MIDQEYLQQIAEKVKNMPLRAWKVRRFVPADLAGERIEEFTVMAHIMQWNEQNMLYFYTINDGVMTCNRLLLGFWFDVEEISLPKSGSLAN